MLHGVFSTCAVQHDPSLCVQQNRFCVWQYQFATRQAGSNYTKQKRAYCEVQFAKHTHTHTHTHKRIIERCGPGCVSTERLCVVSPPPHLISVFNIQRNKRKSDFVFVLGYAYDAEHADFDDHCERTQSTGQTSLLQPTISLNDTPAHADVCLHVTLKNANRPTRFHVYHDLNRSRSRLHSTTATRRIFFLKKKIEHATASVGEPSFRAGRPAAPDRELTGTGAKIARHRLHLIRIARRAAELRGRQNATRYNIWETIVRWKIAQTRIPRSSHCESQRRHRKISNMRRTQSTTQAKRAAVVKQSELTQ